MPKNTFFNIDKKKRERFLKVCFREFSAHEFNTASVSLIVQELEIAKGSVYQYFENKDELYSYLVDLAVAEKEKYVNSAENTKSKTFLSWYNARLKAKFEFDKQKPLYSEFLKTFYLQKNNPGLRDKYLDVKHTEFAVIAAMLKKFPSSVKKKQDIDKIAFLLLELENSVGDYAEIEAGRKLSTKAKKSLESAQDTATSIVSLLKKIIDKAK